MGDDIQAMKAGILEVADILVINKSDYPGADRTEEELQGLLSMSERPEGWVPPVLRTIATEGSGVDACVEALNKYQAFLHDSGLRRRDEILAQKERLLELACTQTREYLLNDVAAAARIHDLATQIADRKLDPYTAAEEVIQLHAGRRTTERG
jgi:LAO/AO transport system kinase